MFTLRNKQNVPLNISLGEKLGDIHLPAMGYLEVEGQLSDLDPLSTGGRYITRRTVEASEGEAPPAPPPDKPVQPAAPKPAAKPAPKPKPEPTPPSNPATPAWLRPQTED